MNNKGRWIRITDCQNIPLREGRPVKVGGREIAIFNMGSRFLAVDNRCPHKGGPLSDGIVSGTSVVCPLHVWKVNLETGKAANGIGAPPCIETFRTRVEDGIVMVELPVVRFVKEEMPVVCVDRPEPDAWLESSAP
jgi:nitrite reductase (NADH) small subunit